jgi:hypothetical protein
MGAAYTIGARQIAALQTKYFSVHWAKNRVFQGLETARARH